MDEDKRKQKLQAGKEKLAAFQKKRARKKKSTEDGGQIKSSGDTDASSSSDIAYSDSDDLTVSGDEGTQDNSREFLKMRKALQSATERITELEESLQGKQQALDKVVEENAQLKISVQTAQNEDFVLAIRKRDEIIQQLSAHIQKTEGATEANYTAAAEAMAREVQQLQQQLAEAGKLLQSQNGKQAESSQTLQEARRDVLILQQELSDKSLLLNQMEDKLSSLTQECDQLKSMNDELQRKGVRLKETGNLVHSAEDGEGSQGVGSVGEVELLRKELSDSKKRELETGEVVKKLMQDVEEMRKYAAGKTVSKDTVAVSEMEERVQKTMAELDEQYGLQIAQMKDELLKHFEEERRKTNSELRQRNDEYEKLLTKFKESESLQQTLQLELEQFIHSDSDRTEELIRLEGKCEELANQLAKISDAECKAVEENTSLKDNILQLESKIGELTEEKAEREKLEKEILNVREEKKVLLEKMQESENRLLEMETMMEENRQLSVLLTELENKMKSADEEKFSETEEIQRLQDDNKDLNEKVEGLKSELEKYEEQSVAFQKEKERMALELDQMNEDFEQMSQKAQKNEQLVKDVEDLTSQLSSLQLERQSLQSQNEELRNKINLQQDSVVSQKSQLEKLVEENSALKDKISLTEQENVSFKTEVGVKATELKEIQKILDENEKENSDLQNELERLRNKNSSLSSIVTGLKNKVESEKEKTEIAEAEIAQKNDEITRLKSHVSEIETELGTLRNEGERKTMKPEVVVDLITPTEAKGVTMAPPSEMTDDSSMENPDLEGIIEQMVVQEIVPSQNSSVACAESRTDTPIEVCVEKDDNEKLLVEFRERNEFLDAEIKHLHELKSSEQSYKSQIESLNESLQASTDKEKEYHKQLLDLKELIDDLKREKEVLADEVAELNQSSFTTEAEIDNLKENIKDLENERRMLVNKLEKVLMERDAAVEDIRETSVMDQHAKFDDSLEDADDESKGIPKCSSLNDSLDDGAVEESQEPPNVSALHEDSADVRGYSEMVRNCMPTLEGHLFSSSFNVGKDGASALLNVNNSATFLDPSAHVLSIEKAKDSTEKQSEHHNQDDMNVRKEKTGTSCGSDTESAFNLDNVVLLKSQIHQLEEDSRRNAEERSEILNTMEGVSALCERLRMEKDSLKEERYKLKQDYEVLQESVSSLRDELDNKQEELEETVGRLNSSTANYEDVKSSYERLQDHYDMMGDENHSLRIDYNQLQGKYDALLEENETLARSVKDSEILSAKIFSESEELMQRLGELEQSNKELAVWKESYESLECESENLKSENFELRENCECLEKQNSDLEKRVISLEEEMCTMSAKYQKDWEKIDQLTKENVETKDQLDKKERELVTLTTRNNSLQGKLEAMEKENSKTTDMLKTLEKRVSEKEKLRTENENLRSQLRIVSMEMNERKSENVGLQEKLKAMEEAVERQRENFEERMHRISEESVKHHQENKAMNDTVKENEQLISDLRSSLEQSQKSRDDIQENVNSMTIQIEELLRMHRDAEEKLKQKEEAFAQERAELEERIDSLNIQAEEFMRMRQDLEEKLNTVSTNEKPDNASEDGQSLKEKLSELESKLAEKATVFEDIAEKVKHVEEENEKLHNVLDERCGKIEEYKKEEKRLKKRLNERENFLEVLSAENESLKYSNEELLKSEKEKNDTFQQIVSEKDHEIERLKSELTQEVESRMEEKNQTIDQLREEINIIRSSITNTECKNKDVQEEGLQKPLIQLQENLSKITQDMAQTCAEDGETSVTNSNCVDNRRLEDETTSVSEDNCGNMETYDNDVVDSSSRESVSSLVQNIELKKEVQRLQERIQLLQQDKSDLKARMKGNARVHDSDEDEQMEDIFEENCRLMDLNEKLNSDLSAVKEELEILRRDCSCKSEEVENLRVEISSLKVEKENRNVNESRDTDSAEKSQLQETVSDLQEEVLRKESQVETLSNKILELVQELGNLKTEYTSLLKQVKEEADRTKNTTAALEESMKVNTQLKDEMSSLQRDVLSISSSHTEFEETLSSVEKAVHTTRTEIDQLESALEWKGSSENEVKKTMEEMEMSLMISRSGNEELMSRVEVLEAELGQGREMINELHENLRAAEIGCNTLTERQEDLDREREKLEETIVALQSEKKAISFQLEEQREQIDELSKDLEVMKGRNEERKEDFVSGVEEERISEAMKLEIEGLKQTVAKKDEEIEELGKKNDVLVEENDSLKLVQGNLEKIKMERDKLLTLHDALSEDLYEMQTKYEAVRSLMDDTKKECNNEIEKLREQLSNVNVDVTGLRDTLESLEQEMNQTVEQKSQLMLTLEEERSRRREVVAEQQRLKDINDKFNKDLQNQRKANETLLSSLASEGSSGFSEVPNSASADMRSQDGTDSFTFMALTFDASTQTDSDSVTEQQIISQVMSDYESRVLELSMEVDSLKTEYDELKLKHENETIELQKRIDQIKTSGNIIAGLEISDASEDEENYASADSSMSDVETAIQEERDVRLIDDSTYVSVTEHNEENVQHSEDKDSQTELSSEHFEIASKSEIQTLIEERCKEKLAGLEYDLEEKYAFEFREKTVELMDRLEKEKKEFIKQTEQTLKHKMQVVEAEKHQEFVQALQKMKKDYEKRHHGKKQKHDGKELGEDPSGKGGEQRKVVLRLRKENQVLAEARDEMMRQIDQLQKENSALRGENEDDDDGSEHDIDECEILPRHTRRSHSVVLDWALSPFSSFDQGGMPHDVVKEIACQREECQMLYRKYQELLDQVYYVEPPGNFNHSASLDSQHSRKAPGFEPEIMTPTTESDNFIEEVFQRAEAAQHMSQPRLHQQSSSNDEFAYREEQTSSGLEGELEQHLIECEQVDGHDRGEGFIAEKASKEYHNASEDFITAENDISSHFSPERFDSVEEEIIIGEGFFSTDLQQETEVEVDSQDTPFSLAGRSASMPSLLGKGDAEESWSLSVNVLTLSAKRHVECMEELRSKNISDKQSKECTSDKEETTTVAGKISEKGDAPQSPQPSSLSILGLSAKRHVECMEELKSRGMGENSSMDRKERISVENFISIPSVTSPPSNVKLGHRRTRSETCNILPTDLFVRQNSYESDDAVEVRNIRNAESESSLDILQRKIDGLEFQKTFLEEKIKNVEHLFSDERKRLEKDKQDISVQLQNEILLRKDLEEEIESLNAYLCQLDPGDTRIKESKFRSQEVEKIQTDQSEESITHLHQSDTFSIEGEYVVDDREEDLQQELCNMQARVCDMTKEKEQLENSVLEMEAELKKQQNIIKDKERIMKDLRDQIHSLKMEMSEKGQQSMNAKDSMKKMQAEIEKLHRDINAEQESRNSEVKNLKEENDKLQGDVQLRSEYLEESEKRAESLICENQMLTEKINVLDTVKSDLKVATEEIQKLNEESKERETLIANLEQEQNLSEEQLKRKEEEVQGYLEKIKEYEHQSNLDGEKDQPGSSSSPDIEIMKLKGQVFELSEALVERGNNIVRLEGELEEADSEIMRLRETGETSESCQYCEDMEKAVKEKDAYIKKLEEHLLGLGTSGHAQSLPSSTEVTPTQSPRESAKMRNSTPKSSPRGREMESESPQQGRCTDVTETSSTSVDRGSEEFSDDQRDTSLPKDCIVPKISLGNLTAGDSTLDLEERSDPQPHDGTHRGRRRVKKSGSGKHKSHRPLLPWRSPLDDLSDQSTLSASSSPRVLEKVMESHFVPESHSSFRSRSPSGSSVSGSIDSSDRIISGLGPEEDGHVALENKHFELIDEISQLRRDLRETKSIYTQENALLQEALDREKWMKESMRSKLGMSGTIVNFDLSAELISLRQKVAILQETNKMLHSENDQWLRKIQAQEQLVLQLRESLGQDVENFDEVDVLFGKQVMMFQKQRNELLEKIHEKDLENNRLSNQIGDMNVIEENLRREKDLLKVKLREKEDIESELVQKKLELERQVQHQQKLEDIIYHKNEMEKELMKQKRLLELDLSEIESKLQEKEELLELQKSQLLKELKCSEPQSPTAAATNREEKLASLIQKSRSILNQSSGNVCRLQNMLEKAEKEHSDAVHTLKTKYRTEFQKGGDSASEHERERTPSETSDQECGHSV